jgi:acetoacetyl-CoA synthetase
MKLWQPSSELIENSNMFALMTMLDKKNYAELYQYSIDFPEAFWNTVAEFCQIQFSTSPEKILDNASQKMFQSKWFVNAKLNFAQNLLKRRDEKPALIYCNEKNEREVISYKVLYERTAQLRKVLMDKKVSINDRVAGFLPNTPEAIIAMLATTSLGAIWTVCSPDYGSEAVVDRFHQIEPKILIAKKSHSYLGKFHNDEEKVKIICAQLPSVEHLLFIEDIHLSTVNQRDNDEIEFVQTAFDHPLYILYSSGTTGLPKCIVHGAGGTLLQHLKELTFHVNLKKEDVIFYYTATSWMMWNWFVSSLSIGATLVLYDGSPFFPADVHLFDLIDQEKITVFGTSAKYLSALEKKNQSPIRSHSLSSLKTILSTGSPLLPEQFDYVYHNIKQDVCLSSISGGTDIISCFVLGNPILPVYKGEIQCIGLGMKVEVYNENGDAVFNEKGELVCTQAFPSMPVYFWNDPANYKYHHAYFEKYPEIWSHGDYAEITSHDGIIIYGRSDAILNPGGIRIGTAEIYRVVEKIPEIMESIAAGKEDENDIQVYLFVKLSAESKLTEALIQQIRKNIKEQLSPHHVPAKIIQVPDIPRTITGKIVELAVREVINHRPVKNMDSIANPEVLAFFNTPQ